MILSKSKCILFALVALVSDETGTRAFVPDDTRARIGGGKNLITASAPPESLSFSSVFQKVPKDCRQHSPRMSEASFRLDYVQGIRPPDNKVSGPVNDPVEDSRENTNDGTYA